MPTSEYYTSERFIWDKLCADAARGLRSIYDVWKSTGKAEPFLLAWPSEPIFDDNGKRVEDTCLIDLPGNRSSWSSTMRTFAQRTKAYALLLTEQLENEVRVVLESHHGTRSWSIPIRRSGDVQVLGDVVVKDNTHKIGILWQSRQTPD